MWAAVISLLAAPPDAGEGRPAAGRANLCRQRPQRGFFLLTVGLVAV